MKLITVGTVAFDSIATPFESREKVIGGAATYISMAAAYLNGDCGVVSVVGDDFPEAFMNELKSRGVDLAGLQIKEGEKSFHWSGKYHLDMNSRDTLATDLNVLATFEPNLPENYRDAEYVMLGNLVPAVQIAVLNQMNKRPKLVVLDTMNFWMDCALEELLSVIKRVDVITINDEEARQLSGEYSLVKAAAKIHTMGPKYVVIKKGEHGALLFHNKDVFFAPALPLEEVFDPTGAGDTFAGGFAGFITQSENVTFENMKSAIIYGSNLASFCVEKFGTERMLGLKSDEVNARLQQFKSLTQFDIEIQ
jgi:sugar/nucleoside kinase (ribokinase family)